MDCLTSWCDSKWLLSGGSQPSVREQQPNRTPSLQCRGHRGTGVSLSGLDGWNQHSAVMQSMCATDTACVIISAIQFYQPPPEGKGGCQGGESSHLGDNPENGPGAGLRSVYNRSFS